MTPLEQAAQCLPLRLREAVLRQGGDVEEVHLRAGRPLTVAGSDGREYSVLSRGRTLLVTGEELRTVLELATRASFHSAQDKLRGGFLPLRGGHRLGITGTADVRDGSIWSYRSLSSLCLRLAHPVRAVEKSVKEKVFSDNSCRATLIISPPGGGKTTLLRELLRIASDEYALRCGVADERGELAALWHGVPQLDVGQHTDVLDGCPKAQALSILLRTMSPQLLAMDEITAAADAAALSEAANCAVPLLATAHAASVEELRRRPLYRKLLEERIFEQLVRISRENGRRVYRVEPLGDEMGKQSSSQQAQSRQASQ